MKAPLVMLKLLPPIFLFHLVRSFRFFFEIFFDLFSRSGNFLTVIRMLFLIAQIKRFGTLNATQKTAALYGASFLKKSGNNCLKIVKKALFDNNGQFLAVFLDFLRTVLCRGLRKRFQIFHHKGGPLRSKSYPTLKKGRTNFQKKI